MIHGCQSFPELFSVIRYDGEPGQNREGVLRTTLGIEGCQVGSRRAAQYQCHTGRVARMRVWLSE